MLNILLKIIGVFFTIYGFYYIATGLFAFLKPVSYKENSNKKHKFSIIIAARNE